MNKMIFIPILSFVALLLKHFAGIEIGDDIINAGADALLAIVTIVGFFMHPRKVDKPPSE